MRIEKAATAPSGAVAALFYQSVLFSVFTSFPTLYTEFKT